MQAIRRVVKNTGILYMRMAITVFISLYSTRLILEALGVADFGLFNVVGGVVSMLGFLNSSMASATQRFISYAQGAGDLERVKRIFNMSTILHAGIAVLIVLVLEIVGYFFFNGILNIKEDRLDVAKIIYHFMMVNTFFTVLSVPYEAVITSHENMTFYAVLGVLEAVLKLAIAVYISYSAFDHLIAYGFLMAGLSIFLLILRRIYCHRYYTECVFDFSKYYQKSLMKEISSFAGWSLLGSATSMVAFYGQGILMNVFFGTLVNAAQGIATQISGQLGVFSLTLSKALNPLIDKSEGAGNRSLMLKATLGGTKISFFLLGFLCIPFLIKMPYILGLWLKNVPEFTVIFCRLLLVRNLVEQLYMPLINALGAVGKIKKYQIASSLLNCVPFVFTYIFFKIGYPPYALYLIFLFFSMAKVANVAYYASINCGLQLKDFYFNVVFACFISFTLALCLAFFSLCIFSNQFFQLISVTIIGIFSYMVLIWIFALTKQERILVLNLKDKFIFSVNKLF
ncbi:MATE family efflux transporter [Flavobacterium sp. LHD-80]|uniref:MATE family efflux transporter n=1 Tax=Flavobacterium sp. LHD-80 TaxID=3071411 RepID=UPI0027E1D75F|nr:MATE family efflux transporter [Flavobacterium sp. LHD-80]MDQ6471039.1 MATE family efflux transporter [Flavobacterium sp. LHD-80]